MHILFPLSHTRASGKLPVVPSELDWSAWQHPQPLP